MTSITREELNGFFEEVVRHPRLLWDANNTGCEAKADLVAELAFELGYQASKVWIRPLSSSDSFLIYLNEAGTESTAWNYHVAVLLEVHDFSETERLVIDPTLFDAPVSVDQWKERLSRLSDQYDAALEVKESKREAFFGPEDFLTAGNRVKALARREEILQNSADINDPIVFEGLMMRFRGAFVDELMQSDPERFGRLRVMLRNDPFSRWFKKPIRNHHLSSQLGKSTFYGIDTKEIKDHIDLSKVEASKLLKQHYWEPIGTAFKRLTARSEELLSGGFNTETMTFKIDWEEAHFREAWFSPNSEEIWSQYGIFPSDLQG